MCERSAIVVGVEFKTQIRNTDVETSEDERRRKVMGEGGFGGPRFSGELRV